MVIQSRNIKASNERESIGIKEFIGEVIQDESSEEGSQSALSERH